MEFNTIHQGDCIEQMGRLNDGSIDLVFADPPFNIGYEYDQYDDRRQDEDYLDWSKRWIGQVHRILNNDGTFWLAIGDEYAAELKVLATREFGFTCRSWVIWYYTFGVNCKYKFSRSHAHLFHFVKNAKKFTFNSEDQSIRVPSARALVYGDKRANPKGRLPDDTWILRPQDAPESFQPTDDVWYFSRVAGTFRERQGFHGCQMPEQLLGRIIRVSSHGERAGGGDQSSGDREQDPEESSHEPSVCPAPRRGTDSGREETTADSDIVLDPFAGSGTTLAVAKKLGRRFVGLELSAEYVTYATERLAAIRPGDPLDGPADPLSSAPSTADGVRLEDRERRGRKTGSRKKKAKVRQEPRLFE